MFDSEWFLLIFFLTWDLTADSFNKKGLEIKHNI